MLRIVKIVFLVTAIAALTAFAWRSRTLLATILHGTVPLRLAAAALVWLCMNVVAAGFTSRTYRRLGEAIPFATAVRIHVGNLPARYLPGGIWHTVGRAAEFRRLGISARSISIFVFLENVLAAGVAFVMGGALLFATRGDDRWSYIAAGAAAVAAIVMLLLPALSSRFAGVGRSRLTYSALGELAAWTTLSWAIASFAFVTYVRAFPELAETLAPLETAGGYLFSWGIGFITVFAPQGVGVFELVAAELLRGSMPLIGMAALLAGFRLVIVAADAVAFGSLLLWSGFAVSQRGDLLGNEPDQENDDRSA